MLGLLRNAERALNDALSAPLAVGTAAPDFTLPNQRGEAVRLSALRGQPVVLVFYPVDDTPVCTVQLRDFNAELDTLTAAGARVFGVNPGDGASHTAFCGKLGLGFDLLVDAGARVAEQYRAKYGPVALVRRTVYAIGADGRIVFAARNTPAPSEVLAALGASKGAP
ncbi:MAG: peroxiredoxin [Bradymonadia bacterium]|jgi:peroxiredoxin Q/BCP